MVVGFFGISVARRAQQCACLFAPPSFSQVVACARARDVCDKPLVPGHIWSVGAAVWVVGDPGGVGFDVVLDSKHD